MIRKALRVRYSLLAAPVAWLLVGAFSHRWTSEDAFITFRVVTNLWRGHGPVFNPGERVEAYTHPLWLLLLSILAYPTGQIERTALYLGLFCAGAAVVLALAAAVRLHGRDPVGVWLPAGALIFVALPPAWDFATSGLEMSLAIFWIAGSYWLLTGDARGSRAPAAALAWFGLGPLIRPEFALFVIPFVAAVVYTRWPDVWRDRLRAVAALCAIPLAYQFFRMVYFVSVLPNPAYAKEAFLWMPDRGLNYAWNFVHSYKLWVPAAGLAGVIATSWSRYPAARLPMASLISGAVLHALYVVGLGGDFMHARLLLPGTFAVTMAVAASPVRRRRGDVLVMTCLLVIAAWAAVCSWRLRPPILEDPIAQIVDERQFYVNLSGVAHPVVVADYWRSGWIYSAEQYGPINRSICFHNIGLVGFTAGSHIRVIDTFGLADPIASRLRLASRTRAGHEKGLPLTWCWARVDPSNTTPAVEDARAALGCGELQELMNAITEPAGYRHVWRNMSIAVKTRNLRIPVDPTEARGRFCK